MRYQKDRHFYLYEWFIHAAFRTDAVNAISATIDLTEKLKLMLIIGWRHLHPTKILKENVIKKTIPGVSFLASEETRKKK